MLGHSDYKVLILRNNGSIETYEFNSPMELQSAYDAMLLTLQYGEVIRSMAFGKTLKTFDSEVKSYKDYPALWLSMRSPEEKLQDEKEEEND